MLSGEWNSTIFSISKLLLHKFQIQTLWPNFCIHGNVSFVGSNSHYSVEIVYLFFKSTTRGKYDFWNFSDKWVLTVDMLKTLEILFLLLKFLQYTLAGKQFTFLNDFRHFKWFQYDCDDVVNYPSCKCPLHSGKTFSKRSKLDKTVQNPSKSRTLKST